MLTSAQIEVQLSQAKVRILEVKQAEDMERTAQLQAQCGDLQDQLEDAWKRAEEAEEWAEDEEARAHNAECWEKHFRNKIGQAEIQIQQSEEKARLATIRAIQAEMEVARLRFECKTYHQTETELAIPSSFWTEYADTSDTSDTTTSHPMPSCNVTTQTVSQREALTVSFSPFQDEHSTVDADMDPLSTPDGGMTGAVTNQLTMVRNGEERQVATNPTAEAEEDGILLVPEPGAHGYSSIESPVQQPFGGQQAKETSARQPSVEQLVDLTMGEPPDCEGMHFVGLNTVEQLNDQGPNLTAKVWSTLTH
jgi:hypothetical protein